GRDDNPAVRLLPLSRRERAGVRGRSAPSGVELENVSQHREIAVTECMILRHRQSSFARALTRRCRGDLSRGERWVTPTLYSDWGRSSGFPGCGRLVGWAPPTLPLNTRWNSHVGRDDKPAVRLA